MNEQTKQRTTVPARLAALILIWMTAALVTAGCRSNVLAEPDAAKTLTVISTIFPPYDFAKAITGGKAEVRMLLPPATEVHAFEPTPGDIKTIHNCDLFIYVGGESDAWVETALSSGETVRTLTLMDCVEPVREEIVPGMEAETTEHGDYDEHVWTSPRNGILITEKITDALCDIDTANEDFYRQNAAVYIEQLHALDAAFAAATTDTARDVLVFGDRFPFRYLTDAYGLTYAAAFPGCAAETEASAATVAFLIDKVRTEDIPVVFHTEMANDRMAAVIAEETGAQIRVLYACHTVSREDYINGVGYIELMMRNAAALKEALG